MLRADDRTFERCSIRVKVALSYFNTLPTDSLLIAFCHRRLPTNSLSIGFLSPIIFLIIWVLICYLVLRYFAQLRQLRCFVSSHSFIPIWETYRSRWTKRMVLESLNGNRTGARENLRLRCRSDDAVESLAVGKALIRSWMNIAHVNTYLAYSEIRVTTRCMERKK